MYGISYTYIHSVDHMMPQVSRLELLYDSYDVGSNSAARPQSVTFDCIAQFHHCASRVALAGVRCGRVAGVVVSCSMRRFLGYLC